jgi:alcohol dehydrogenase
MPPTFTRGLRKFLVPEIVFGADARHMVGQYARNLGARKVLVVSDPGVKAASWMDQAIADIQAEGLPCVAFDEISPNPRSEQVMQGVELFRRENCNVIVAVGGGSPMDCAKGIGIAHSNHQDILAFEGPDRVAFPGPPLICIPTTAGSSADVSQFAILTDTSRRVKIAIISKTTVPDAALIDPVTTTSMDPYLTACTGLDALTHAVEAYVSTGSSPLTDVHALEAIRLVVRHLLAAIQNPYDLFAREQMMLASLNAGLAFSNASLGAVHAMAHSLGGLLDLTHGECNAILLRNVVDFNFPFAEKRYLDIGQAMGLSLEQLPAKEQKEAILEKLTRLTQSAGVDRSLGQIGMQKEAIPRLASFALHDPCLVTNPVFPSQRDLEVIFERTY